MSAERVDQTRTLLDIFRMYRDSCPIDPYDLAQFAIFDVISAFKGVIPTDSIVAAIGDAESPNAVSCAVRECELPL